MRFVVSETFQSIRRNVSMIVSVTLVTFISFLFIGASVLLQAQVNRAQAQWYDKVEVVVWLCPDGQSQAATCATGKAPTQAQIASIENTIQTQLSDAVQKTTYVSREDFFRNTFTKQYPGGVYRGRTMTAADMQDSLRLKLKNPQRYQEVSQVLSGRQGVEEVVDQRQIFEPVFRILNSATIVTIVLAAVMILVAILLTGTTIRMSAANRKEETEIERLVGASNWTIRMPFILEGALAALLGSVLAVLALAAIVQVFVTGWLASSVSWINLITTRTVWLISPFLIVGAIVISVISSWASLRRYLQV
jgi:cell division transport system permease protein